MALDVYELRVNAVDTADRFQSVLHYQSAVTGEPDPEGKATVLATVFDANMRTLLLACWPVSTLYTSLRCRRINNTGGPSFYGPFGSSVQGTAIASSKVDASISAVLTAPYNGAIVGGPDKFRVGRMFLGSVPFNFLQDNAWSSDAIAAYTAVATALVGPFSSGGDTWLPCVWAKKYAKAAPIDTWSWVPTIGCIRKRAFPSR